MGKKFEVVLTVDTDKPGHTAFLHTLQGVAASGLSITDYVVAQVNSLQTLSSASLLVLKADEYVAKLESRFDGLEAAVRNIKAVSVVQASVTPKSTPQPLQDGFSDLFPPLKIS